ncbi:MAG: hypothetical protein GC172_08960 [Phycisphaera sp.]|nr:hypothetical protein [Phycisphaera sp.]
MSRIDRALRTLRERRGLLFALPAAAFAVLVILAALNVDRGTPRTARESRLDSVEDLLPPRIASAEELARASGATPDQTSVSLASGAWVQVADEEGRLAQQYSATKLDPLPGSQVAMVEPRAVIYMKDGRVLSLASRKGVAYVPRRALESGTLEDDVVVRLFRPERGSGRAVDIDRDAPAVVVTAESAQFDGVLGEVRCDKAVRVATEAGSFAGEGLSLVLDGDGDGVERLVVERALEPIRIDTAARAVARADAARAAARGGETTSTQPPAQAPAQPAAQPAAPSTPPAPSQPATRAPFYRLVMLGGVEVVRVKDGVRTTIKGEELVAVFSLESRSLDDLAFLPRPPQGTHHPMHASLFPRAQAALAVLPLVFAQAGAVPEARSATEPDGVTVTFGGRLVMLPAVDPADQLSDPDEIRFDVLGPRVEVVDGRSRSRIVCSRLRYGVREERIEAEGRAGVPLTVTNRRMQLEGTRFTASLRDGEGRLDGGGRLALSRGSARAVGFLEVAPALIPDATRMLVSADPAHAVLAVRQDPPARRVADPRDFEFDPKAQELEILWKGGVDLRFDGGGEDATLSLARFGGGVEVFGRQFELDAATLEVAFSPSGGERIDAIIADGGGAPGVVEVRRLGGAGAMRAGRIELFLAESLGGDAMPRRLVARSAVEARDDRQTIWTEDLVVDFRPRAAASPAGEPDRGEAAATDPLGEVDIDAVEAKGGVQVLLREGARVFAQELKGDAARRSLRLTGDNVAIVRSNIVADNLRDLRFDDATRSARSEGPGRFRAFREPLAQREGKVERPEPTGAATLEATWSENLDFTELSETRSTLDLRGDVRVRSRPDGATSDAVDARALLLEIGADPADRSRASGSDAVADSSRRSLEQFIAKGDARVESRAWETEERKGDPRVFRVTGEHIEYDMRSREGLVVGDGGILVNLPPKAAAAPADGARGASSPLPGAINLGGDGTTRFRWKRRMELKRAYDDVFTIRMESGVELLHAGLRPDDTLAMTCDTLEATVRRPVAEGAKPDARDAAGADLGGPAELLGVMATGGVFVRTPEQDIRCGSFDYSVTTGIATLTAAEGGSVEIAVKGQATPIRAQQVVWDLRSGRLQVLKASGTAGR